MRKIASRIRISFIHLNRNMEADCVCSGMRSCLVCEKKKRALNLEKITPNPEKTLKTFYFCVQCQRLYEDVQFKVDCSSHTQLLYPDVTSGITVIQCFVNKEEEALILKEIEKFPWRESQSGRRKQDFGPKVNFKKRKLKCGNFSGLPRFSEIIIQRLHDNVLQLNSFRPVELCNLEYCPERGASIDAHIDDKWLWGEHLVTLNLLSNTVLTLTHTDAPHEIQIPMPRKSLMILSGEARHRWMHGIKREHVTSRRIAVTLRELSKEFLTAEKYDLIGEPLLKIAETFDGKPTSI